MSLPSIDFSILLCAHMERRGFSAAELARRVRVHRRNVVRWMNGETLPNRRRLNPVADVFMLTGEERREFILAGIG
jgi:transcriptional regulator with XRE-family HTH domain